MPTFASPGPFAREIRAQGTALLRAQPNGRYADWGQRARAGAFFALAVAAYAALLSGAVAAPAALLAALASAAWFLFAVAAAHDASHDAFFRAPWANRALSFLAFAPYGISSILWGRRHTKLHHMFANVSGTEIDHESTTLLRLSPHEPWRPIHRLQAATAPLFYALLFTSVAYVEDFKYLRDARAEDPKRFRRWSVGAEFWAAKLVHGALIFAAPALALDLSALELSAGYLIAVCAPSFVFAALVVGTHLVEEAAFPEPDAEDRLPHDWATHQLLTSIDWSPERRWLTLLSGGANAHVAHHLFPEAASCHMPRLNDLVGEMVAKHGKPRHVMSFWEMTLSHFRLLIALGRRPHAAPTPAPA